MWNLACMGLEINDSPMMAMQDLTCQLIWMMNEMTTTRCDQWLKQFKGKIPMHDILNLRSKSDLNGADLFDAALLKEAQEKARVKKSRKQQDEIAKATLAALKHKGADPKRRFERSSFNKKTYKAKDSTESEKLADKGGRDSSFRSTCSSGTSDSFSNRFSGRGHSNSTSREGRGHRSFHKKGFSSNK